MASTTYVAATGQLDALTRATALGVPVIAWGPPPAWPDVEPPCVCLEGGYPHRLVMLPEPTTALAIATQKTVLDAEEAANPVVPPAPVLATDARLNDARVPLPHSHADADIPAGIARDAEVSSAISAHAGEADPHSGYQLETSKGVANGYAGLDSGALVPNGQLGSGTADATTFLRGDRTWTVPAGAAVAPWRTKIHTLWGDGNPAQQDVLWAFQNSAVSVAAPTATAIGVSVGRLVSFRYESSITVNRIRWFQLLSLPANTYTFGIYSGTSRIAMLDPMPAGAAGWNSVLVSPAVIIPADTLCWFGIGVKLTGTAAPWRTPVSPIANSLGLANMPGSLNSYGPRFAQVALTLGAWPTTLPSLAAAAYASAGTTGTIPVFYADNSAA